MNLNAFCGGLATLFPGTCSVESDFSVLRWEKDSFRKSLSDFGLEAILQAKQFLKMQQIQINMHDSILQFMKQLEQRIREQKRYIHIDDGRKRLDAT